MTKIALLLLASAAGVHAQPPFWEQLRATIQRYLGRPYVWGATGTKSFDCSGFVWRVYQESGVLLKRTTARKLYFALATPPQGAQWRAGNLVFFDTFQHVGIVNDRDTFYHAHKTGGTTLSPFAPYWAPRITGVRVLSAP